MLEILQPETYDFLLLVTVGHSWQQIERWRWPNIPGGTGVVFVQHNDGCAGWPIEDAPWRLTRVLDDLLTTGHTERPIGDFVNITRVQRLN